MPLPFWRKLRRLHIILAIIAALLSVGYWTRAHLAFQSPAEAMQGIERKSTEPPASKRN
jgi:hypothetical protein